MPAGYTPPRIAGKYETFYVLDDDSTLSYVRVGKQNIIIPDPPINTNNKTCVTCKGLIYYIAGTSVSPSNAVQTYNPLSNIWSSVTNITNTIDAAGSASVNNKVYVIGGATASFTVQQAYVQEYDPMTNIWTQKGNMPTPVTFFGCCAYNNVIYVLGGLNESTSTYTNAFYSYEPNTDVWTVLATFPHLVGDCSIAGFGGQIFCVGGNLDDSGNATNNIFAYNISSNTWIQKANMPAAIDFNAIVVLNNTLYSIGGENSAGTSQKTVIKYDPNNDTWAADTPLTNTHTFALGAVVVAPEPVGLGLA